MHESRREESALHSIRNDLYFEINVFRKLSEKCEAINFMLFCQN